MVKKSQSVFSQLKIKKQAGTLTPVELKKYKKLKKEKRLKKEEKTLNASNISLDNSVSEPQSTAISQEEVPVEEVPVVETPKKRKKANPPASQEFPLSPGSSGVPSAQTPVKSQVKSQVNTQPDTPTKALIDVVQEELQQEALKGIIVSQYKAMLEMQSVMEETRRRAELLGIDLSQCNPVVKAKPGAKPKSKKMTNFTIFAMRPDIADLTLAERKEKWAAVPDSERKELSKEAREMNKESGWVVPKDKKANGTVRPISAYTAFTTLQISENKMKMVDIGPLWKTLTLKEKEQYQNIADTKNKGMVKLHNPDKSVILNTASTDELSDGEE